MDSVKSNHISMLIFLSLVGILSHNLVIPVMATAPFQDQKNYYSPDPGSRSPPSGSHRSPTPPSHGGSSGSPPSHGGSSGSPPSHGGSSGSPPSHRTPSPRGGGGGYTPSPSTPGNCGSPPLVPTPSTPSTPSNPPTPTYNPPSSGTVTPPSPVIVTPPTPTTPFTPSVPTPPFVPDPNSPFSCNYWRTHPTLIWGVFGWFGTLGSAFGVTSLPGVGSSISLPQALSNSRSDGYGLLYREGTASLLNSMVNSRFPLTTTQVRQSFVSALGSNKAAASQGRVFRMANEGKLKA